MFQVFHFFYFCKIKKKVWFQIRFCLLLKKKKKGPKMFSSSEPLCSLQQNLYHDCGLEKVLESLAFALCSYMSVCVPSSKPKDFSESLRLSRLLMPDVPFSFLWLGHVTVSGTANAKSIGDFDQFMPPVDGVGKN